MPKFRTYFLLLAAAALAAFALYRVTSRGEEEDARLPVQPAGGPANFSVAGAGIVEPRTENVRIGSPLAGIVDQLFVGEGDHVDAGDPLFRLDEREWQARLKLRQAALQVAEAQYRRLQKLPRPEELPVRAAQLREAEARVAEETDYYQRAQRLFDRGATTEEEYVRRKLALEAAEAQVTRMRAELELLKAGASYEELAIAEAEVEQARAQIAEVQTDLERLTVRAPMASTVLQVGIRPGEFVGTPPGETLMVLGNVQQLHLRVDIDEHDIPRFAPGAKAQAVMRGYPDRVFQLDFIRVQPFVVPKRNLTGDNTEQVDTRVLQAIYAFREPPGEDLYVGQQLDVYVATLKNGPNMEGRRGPPGRAQATAAAVE